MHNSVMTYRKHLILLNMIFFYQSLDIMVCLVLLMNGLNQIENNSINLFQLMVLIVPQRVSSLSTAVSNLH